MRKNKIVLATFGSHGDLNPFMAVALELQALGLEPVIATMPEYRAKVSAAGIAFHEVRPSAEQIRKDLAIDDRELARRVMADPAFVFRDATFPYLRVAYDDISEVIKDAALVLTSSLAYAARLAAEKHSVPYIAVVLQPAMLLSAYDPPMHPNAPIMSALFRRLGPRLNGGAIHLMKRIAASWATSLTVFRSELGLPPDPRNPIFEGQYSKEGVLALYSPMLGALQPDHPPHTLLTGFAFYDNDPEEDPAASAALTEFLAKGASPLVFVLGSAAHQNAGDFFDVSLEAARKLGRRAVIVTGASPTNGLRDSPDVLSCRYIAYSRLFPAAAVIVHQGGIGTTAQALRAGRPQLIVPFLGDQLDNGSRVMRIGAGRVVQRRRYRVGYAVSQLQALLTTPGHALAATALAVRIRKENGARAAAVAVQRALATRATDNLGTPAD